LPPSHSKSNCRDIVPAVVLPPAARIADYAGVAVAMFALLVWSIGGPAFRLSAFAASIVLWRHAFILEPPIYRPFCRCLTKAASVSRLT
jgi:hypothetical protein